MNGIIENSTWLPITEFAQRRGVSISTLRRKIKSNELEYKMEEGRYLIRCDEEVSAPPTGGFASSDGAGLTREEVDAMIQAALASNALQWRALEARVAGLSRKLEVFSEQMAEVNMLVKIFEERLDERQ